MKQDTDNPILLVAVANEKPLGCHCSHTLQDSPTYCTAVRWRCVGHRVSPGRHHPCVTGPCRGCAITAPRGLQYSCHGGQPASPASQPRQVFSHHLPAEPVELAPVKRRSVHAMPSVIHTPSLPYQCSRAVRFYSPTSIRRSADSMPLAILEPRLMQQDPGAVFSNVPTSLSRSPVPVRLVVQVPTLIRPHVCTARKDGPVFRGRPGCTMPTPCIPPIPRDDQTAKFICIHRGFVHL